MSEPIPDAFRTALRTSIETFRVMSQREFEGALFEICQQAGVDPTTTIAAALKILAGQGCIEAVAAMIVMNLPDKKVREAIKALLARTPDVVDGLVLEELTMHFEEYADAEVEAGRMTVSIDPVTGRKLYSLKDDAES